MNGRSVGAQRRSLTGDCGETVGASDLLQRGQLNVCFGRIPFLALDFGQSDH